MTAMCHQGSFEATALTSTLNPACGGGWSIIFSATIPNNHPLHQRGTMLMAPPRYTIPGCIEPQSSHRAGQGVSRDHFGSLIHHMVLEITLGSHFRLRSHFSENSVQSIYQIRVVASCIWCAFKLKSGTNASDTCIHAERGLQ